jgi:hypothetical protein
VEQSGNESVDFATLGTFFAGISFFNGSWELIESEGHGGRMITVTRPRTQARKPALPAGQGHHSALITRI